MKKVHNSHSVEMRRPKIISGWIWPYVIIPACVAAILAIFFLILGPILLNKIGIRYSLEFWLIALGIWAFVTGLCTLLWIHAGRHLVQSHYYVIADQEIERSKTDGSATVNTYSETIKYKQEKCNGDQPDICFSDEQVIYKHCKQSKHSAPYEDIPIRLERTEVDDENDSKRQMEKEAEQYIQPQVINTDADNYSKFETTLNQIDHQIIDKKAAEHKEFLAPESQEDHPPRRVSYAGVISVNIPPSEQIKIEDEDKNLLHTPRPPTPRFPRGMRVASNDSSVSAQLADIYLNQRLLKDSPSETTETPLLVNSVQEKEASLERIQMKQMEIQQESISITSSEESDSSHSSDLDAGVIITVTDSELSSVNDRNKIKSNTIQTREVKKVRLSDDLEKVNDDIRHKRMSLDRNQFLGWNPEKGVLAEADPGSKEREEMRWRRSLGGWRTSTSTPWSHEVSDEQGNVEEDDDDVFQDTVEKVNENQIEVSHSVTITKAVIHSTSV